MGHRALSAGGLVFKEGWKVTAEKADDYLFEMTGFLIASAERTLGPERSYGACRLIQALYMLSFLPDYVDVKGNELLMKVRAYVDANP